MTNTLYYGDNLDILRQHVGDESVDLVYLDPPFNSNANYNVLFKERSGEESPAQIKAFTDTWEWTQESERTFEQEIVLNPETPPNVKDMITAFRQFIGSNAMMAYLVMMTPRLVELLRVLKPTGSIYLHCDPTASHYLKLAMDAVFGNENFRNEIIWKRTTAHSDVAQGARHMGRIHDTLLRYSKSKHPTWNTVYIPYDDRYIERIYRYSDPDGRKYQTQPLHARKPGGDTLYEWKGKLPPPGRYWAFSKENMRKLDDEGRIVYSRTGVPRYKIYLDESRGRSLQDIWDDVAPVHQLPKERLGYPTQKPAALLERIVQASSNEGDVVLDPFCGCGTAVAAAEKLKRRWTGIDVTHLAVALMKNRLKTAFDIVPGRDYEVVGEPADAGGARALAEQDRYQFQFWAMSLLEAFPREQAQAWRGQGHRRRGLLHRRPAALASEGHRAGEERQGVVAAHPRPEGDGGAREGGAGAVHHAGGADAGHADGGGQRGLLPLGGVAAGLSEGADPHGRRAAGRQGVRASAAPVDVPGGAAGGAPGGPPGGPGGGGVSLGMIGTQESTDGTP